MKRTTQPTAEYFDATLGCTVKVYPEKQTKRRSWMRGESFLGAKLRIPEEGERMFATFSRKNGKY